MLNLYLTNDELETADKDRFERFKQALVTAFPTKVFELFPELDSKDASLAGKGYIQHVPTNREEFISMQQALEEITTMNATDLPED